MPSAAYSLASVRARPVTAARIEFESSRPSTGCLTADEVIVIRRPHLFFCIRGKVSLAKKMVLIRSWSTAARHSSGLVSLKELDGGPPELVTQISTPPNRSSTAATIATRPLSPRSIPPPHSKLQSSPETQSASILWHKFSLLLKWNSLTQALLSVCLWGNYFLGCDTSFKALSVAKATQ